jgi:hypothetical protein
MKAENRIGYVRRNLAIGDEVDEWLQRDDNWRRLTGRDGISEPYRQAITLNEIDYIRDRLGMPLDSTPEDVLWAARMSHYEHDERGWRLHAAVRDALAVAARSPS